MTVTKTAAGKGWRVVVDSIGDAGAGLVRALKEVSPLAESRLAELLYQAPSELLADLDQESAEKIHQTLAASGLECRTLDPDETFEQGDADHELALVVRDPSLMNAAAKLLVQLVGADPVTTRKLLFTSPTVFLGRVSANTAAAVGRRFSALGDVEVDVSRPADALFDVFLGDCSAADRQRVLHQMRGFGIAVEEQPPLLATGLSKAEADRVWEHFGRSGLPLRLVNRDFERFDVRLDAASDSPETIAWLQRSTGMPEKLARKVPGNLPLVLHHNVPFADMTTHLEAAAACGGEASGHLLLFQTFALRVETVGDDTESRQLVQVLAELDENRARAAVCPDGLIEGPLTPPQARWLQWELRQVGTDTELMLR